MKIKLKEIEKYCNTASKAQYGYWSVWDLNPGQFDIYITDIYTYNKLTDTLPTELQRQYILRGKEMAFMRLLILAC